jgi:phosphoribosylanthranilate isomerase
MWIKICGNTNLEDAQRAAELGADAVGFVFASSPRQVTPKVARAMIERLPNTLEKYGVFVDANFDAIVNTVREAGLTGVQLHAAPTAGLAARLRKHFSGPAAVQPLRIIQVLHFAPDAQRFAADLHALQAQQEIDAVLIDSRTATQVGGTGVAFDWQAASAAWDREARTLRLIAAGGLQSENVAQAIATLQPWGVDVASGVESQPGKKDPQRVADFIQAARSAAAKLENAATV